MSTSTPPATPVDLAPVSRTSEIYQQSDVRETGARSNFYVQGADTLEGEGARVVITNKQDDKRESKSKSEQLRELHQLKVDGILNEQEYESAKKNLIDRY